MDSIHPTRCLNDILDLAVDKVFIISVKDNSYYISSNMDNNEAILILDKIKFRLLTNDINS